MSERSDTLPHVVVIGAGFGGLAAAKALRNAPVRITLVDRRNHHLFQPLLYQVATAALSPADIASPIRSIVSRQKNINVVLGEVTGIDTGSREILVADRRIGFDYLIVATGATHSYFGHDEWEAFAPGLKSLEDATEIRRRILIAFERAEIEESEEERKRLLTFLVIGGGPTGVELAGAIAEIARHALAADFRNIEPASSRIILVEAGPRVLPAFPESLSGNAQRKLTKLGVEVRLGKAVTKIDADGALLGEERIASRTVLWAAGVKASPAAHWLDAQKDRAGRVIVEPDLSLPGHPHLFVIGDTAHAEEKGAQLPGVATVAKQQGAFLGKLISARVSGRTASARFHYKNYGNLATIGRKSAVVDFGWVKLTGSLAWLIWSGAHIYFLIGFRNRFAVALNWLWAYMTFERGARLITQTIHTELSLTLPVTERQKRIANS